MFKSCLLLDMLPLCTVNNVKLWYLYKIIKNNQTEISIADKIKKKNNIETRFKSL